MAGQSSVTVKLIGDDDLRHKLTPAIAGRPIRRFLERGTILIFNTAVRNAPVDTGRLKGSVAREIDQSPLPLWGKTGTNLEYGPDVEFGTPPHFVSASELDPWAQRKGIAGGGAAVSEWIGERGTKAQPWLYPALTSNEAAIKALVPVLASEIEQAYANG